MAENRRAAAPAMGLHRSSLYEAAAELKQRAMRLVSTSICDRPQPDTSAFGPVSKQQK